MTDHAFPIVPAAAASYGHVHHDYPANNVFAACGTQVVAPADGTVEDVNTIDRWDPTTDDGGQRGGRWLSIRGDDGVRYYMSHFASVADTLAVGVRVTAGQPVATVGHAGNARSTPCHVHVGFSPTCAPYRWDIRRGVVYPWPYLDAWREGDTAATPHDEVTAWAAEHDAC